MSLIVDNLKRIRQDIDIAVTASAREAHSVTLVAVSKGKPKVDVMAALNAGQRVFGENRLQEAKTKFSDILPHYPDLELHLIGPLQTNKALEAVKLFNVIETLDRPKLALALAKAIKKTQRTPVFYIEVNMGQEPQKSGIMQKDLGSFLDFCRTTCSLTIVGLMCIPPHKEDPSVYFTDLKKLADKHCLKKLSMGMSADFASAIRCGATHVRIGSALFGDR